MIPGNFLMNSQLIVPYRKLCENFQIKQKTNNVLCLVYEDPVSVCLNILSRLSIQLNFFLFSVEL